MRIFLRCECVCMTLMGVCLLAWTGTGALAATSITSTSQNRGTAPTIPVQEQPQTNNPGYRVFANNDLGMHCEVSDHRVVSILPPFNVLHAQALVKGSRPQILTDASVQLFYSAASNPNDLILASPSAVPIYKTDFWDPNLSSSNNIAYDAYNPFYPPGILSAYLLAEDIGLPVPDIERLYLGDGQLSLDQQKMPGESSAYTANTPQPFNRFNTNYPFFNQFSFGYTIDGVNWFAAEGIPASPVDDFGRSSPFPLVRVQASDKTGSLTGTQGAVLSSLDTVIPVAAEITCYKCHASSTDGGTGLAACMPGVDANCAVQGSSYSGTPFLVATSAEDPSVYPDAVKREWAANNNIIRLHDARNGTQLQSSTPVVCQKCHYSPALDLAQAGPRGPDDSDANGRAQRIHHSNSRALHAFHGNLTGVISDMPAPTDPLRFDATLGKPIINTFVQTTLQNACYLCHPGKTTKCLRGAMYSGGLVCQDCHGGIKQVGNDFSQGFSTATPFPAGMTASDRIPWANEPACQSCHTGDAVNNMTADPDVIKAGDGIRLLRAYRTSDPSARPIVAANKRFAENDAPAGQQMLYRLSKDSHSGLYCEACHGSTHAEWPTVGSSGSVVANDNIAATQLQGHAGVIIECSTCHTGTMANSLDGPHGMHPVGQSWTGGHENIAGRNLDACRACHGSTGQGTVLSKVRLDRTITIERGTKTLTSGTLLGCNVCHGNPL
jgi:hypothetical protein